MALITGGLSLLGVIYSNNRTAQSMDAKLDKQQAVTETKLEELTREVRAHNNFPSVTPPHSVHRLLFGRVSTCTQPFARPALTG